MKKRLFTLLLAASLTVLTLPACTKETAQETSTNTVTSESTDTAEKTDAAEDMKDSDSTADTSEKEQISIRLNEVAHSIFYAPMYAAIEEGYFEEEGIALDLTCGFGADKVMTAVLSGEADIGFMGSESSIYTYNEGANDYVVNFAQLTQRAGNFLVAREEMPEFTWNDLKGKTVLGGRKGGMPEMVFEYILKENGIDPAADLEINQSIDFGSTGAAFAEGQGDFTVEFA